MFSIGFGRLETESIAEFISANGDNDLLFIGCVVGECVGSWLREAITGGLLGAFSARNQVE